uniref:EGF-like domain-containing protein n=1 Tax=Chromera velia CCMP2878 TaxID=1169474 RepID=A0A0G4HN11_9ALVE|eukprot:Cvel_29468.t1-p1 / transcript=Cvel_29468.t1 / gene=Cvel_29468 / organism=Chromera_velia_CCMP2878 / gene_product=hypothetical protein / transcript_product=hypothetical protein / location=Cvel_scaffold4036:1903-11010(-) / protein_length=720 / sequence_SO=supercontig / SO=protein_coding / is_pseudo=false
MRGVSWAPAGLLGVLLMFSLLSLTGVSLRTQQVRGPSQAGLVSSANQRGGGAGRLRLEPWGDGVEDAERKETGTSGEEEGQSPGSSSSPSSGLSMVQTETETKKKSKTGGAVKGDVLPSEDDDVPLIYDMLDRLRTFQANATRQAKEDHLQASVLMDAALKGDLSGTVTVAGRKVSLRDFLLEAAKREKKSSADAQHALETVGKFVEGSAAVMGGGGGEAARKVGCTSVTCGQHATCTQTSTGPECVCDAGYSGDGFRCKPPRDMVPQPLLPSVKQPEVADLHMSRLGKDRLVVVFRDVGDNNRGKASVGLFQGGSVAWSPPECFSGEDEAWGPSVVGLLNGRLLVAFRSRDRKGEATMIAAEVPDPTAPTRLVWGSPRSYGRNQSHKAALIPLPDSRVGLFFEDFRAVPIKAADADGAGGAGNNQNATAGSLLQGSASTDSGFEFRAFGNALLIELGEKSKISKLGSYPFAMTAIARITATITRPGEFVLGYRATPTISLVGKGGTVHHETMAVLGYMANDDIVFTSPKVNLEPDGTGAWARSLSLLTAGKVLYAYQVGSEKQARYAVLKVDEKHKRLEVTEGPRLLFEGQSSYLTAVTLPGHFHALVLHEGNAEIGEGGEETEGKKTTKISSSASSTGTSLVSLSAGFRAGTGSKSSASICSLDAKTDELEDCEVFTWAERGAKYVNGVALSPHVLLVAFADSQGVPWYQLMAVVNRK